MDYRGYDIGVEIQGAESEILPSQYAFTLRDSIHAFYSEATFRILDGTGLFNELRLFAEGAPTSLSLGYTEGDTIENKFIVTKSNTDGPATPGLLSGMMENHLLHAWAAEQEVKSEAFDGAIDGVVEELVGEFGFRETHIEATDNKGIWYRPLITQKELIWEILMENARGRESDGTPIFAFIDSNNELYFMSYASLFRQSPQAELRQGPSTPDTADMDTVMEIFPFTGGYANHQHLWNRLHYTLDREDGSLVEEEQRVVDYAALSGDAMPFIGDGEMVRSYTYHGRERVDGKSSDDVQGQIAHSSRPALFQDHFFLSLPLNVNLRAGKTINLTTTYHSDEAYDRTQYFESKYLIERSYHRWRGDLEEGSTALVISRPSATFADGYDVGNRVVQ